MMTLNAVDLLFNLVVALFWVRMWESDRRMAMFNPYLAGVENFTQPLLDAITRASPPRSTRLAAGACWLLLILFRGIALPLTNPQTISQIWTVRLGFETAAPAQYAGWPAAGYLVFSLYSFAVFIFQVWGLATIYTAVREPDRPAEFLRMLTGPLAGLNMRRRLAATLLYGAALTILANFAAAGIFTGGVDAGSRPGWWLLRGLVNALAGISDLLLLLQSLMVILIIGSWIAMFTGGGALMTISREWLDFLLGPFRRFPVRLGMLDLTPIIAFFALSLAHYLLNGYVLRLIYIIIRNA